jgi:hypothetical protein
MEQYLDAVPGDRWVLEDLLRPLGYAQGSGLPVQLWAMLAGVLSGLRGKYSATDVHELFTGPVASLIVATQSHDERLGQPRGFCRLFHSALDEVVRELPGRNPDAPQDVATARVVIARALLDTVGDNHPRDWRSADPYLRAHLATHAAGTPTLDDLIQDAYFLLAADPERLLTALAGGVVTDAARSARAAYEAAAHHLKTQDGPSRAGYLRLSALQETRKASLLNSRTRIKFRRGGRSWRGGMREDSIESFTNMTKGSTVSP